MALRALDNAAWGFASSCFVCETGNDRGLRIPFFHDEEAGVVTAEFAFGPHLSGAPRYAHGGVVLAVLDEAMAWAAIALAGRFAVVQHTATTFDRPVLLDAAHRVTGSVQDHDDRAVTARAEIVSVAGNRLCARAHARLAVLSESSARSAIGPVQGRDADYLRRST